MDIPALNDILTSDLKLNVQERRALQKAGLFSTIDIFLHLPRKYLDRRQPRSLVEYQNGEVNTVARIVSHVYRPIGKRRQLVIGIADAHAEADLVCYGRENIKYLLPTGMRVHIAGAFAYRYGRIQATQFEFEAEPLSEFPEQQRHHYSRFQRVVPLYSLPSSVVQQKYFRLVCHLFFRVPMDSGALDCEQMEIRRYIGAGVLSAIRAAHFPHDPAHISAARTRVARHELLALQLTLQDQKGAEIAHEGSVVASDSDIDIDTILRHYPLSLSFTLTDGQRNALQVIYRDMLHPTRAMKRLLQGDVGVGKTLVALLAMIPLLMEGYQVAFMVPTELLAHQQYKSASALFDRSDIRIIMLSGSIAQRARVAYKEHIADGSARVIIGTHALFSDDIHFARLRMVVIDEQHRFGVEQRVALVEKGAFVHQLYMTATPIPRTLALALYSDFHIVNMYDRPQGRKRIVTRIVSQKNEERVYRAVLKEIQKGHRAYFVYPLIEESSSYIRSAEEMSATLQKTFFSDYTIACIHSHIADSEKNAMMERFAHGEIDILVATSVIEVGVDVADATCIVINNAERFGLAALHQLRGRVGRSTLQSYAFLIYQNECPLSEEAKSRLKVIYHETDGFLISEADLFIRGPGEFTGTKQSGTSRLRTVHFPAHLYILKEARLRARELLRAYRGDALPKCVRDIQHLFK